MRYGWISSNLVDLWARPRFNSERASQLLFAQPVRVLAEKSGFYSVATTDGYRGWVDRRFVQPLRRSEFKNYANGLTSFVDAPQARLYNGNGRAAGAPYFVYYGTRLFTRSTNDSFAKVILPGELSFLIKKTLLVPINRYNLRKITGRMVVAQASRFLGVPYLWGGVTTAGFDCSGFVQTVLSRFGVNIPRDTKDQIHVGVKVERNSIKTGDLLFFKRHVGFAMGRDKILHSSAGGGGVRINSLTPDGIDYREDLDRDFNQARRWLCSS